MGPTDPFSDDSGHIGLIFETVFKNKISYDQLEAVFLYAGTAGLGHK